jgi:peptide/nickel transport system permease protein
MPIARFLLRRALVALSLVFVVSSAALLLTLAAPFTTDDCFQDPAHCEKIREQLGLNRPLLTQYVDWVARAVRFDFGESLLYTRPVADLLRERASNTAVLAFAALVAATLVGIPVGLYTGRRQQRPMARLIAAVSLVLLSTPPLLASLALVLLAARTGWLPVGGMTSAAGGDVAWAYWFADIARHVPLPALALALPIAAMLERLQSQAIRDVANEPFVRAAQARGLSADRAVLTHGWRVSVTSVLGLYGLIVGTLFSGSFIVEVVTAWPGLGRLMYDALRARDLFLVAGCAAAGAACLAIGTFVSDVLHTAADPRTRRHATT